MSHAFISGDHDDRHLSLAVLPQPLKDQKPTSPRHHQIQNHQIWRFSFSIGNPLIAVEGSRDFHPARAKRDCNCFNDLGIVIHDQNMLSAKSF